ncbi:MAG: hypothetical protein KDB14_20465 [Planctomycetales bacterium]|nr:hypothetical protein [Planctomycetales bacterium]
MSFLARVTVLSVRGPRVVCQYAEIHPDAGGAPDHEIFAFQIIAELFEKMQRGRLRNQLESFPLSMELQKTIIGCHPRKSAIEDMIDLLRGRKVKIAQDEYQQQLECREVGVGVIGQENDNFFKVYQPDFNQLLSETARIVGAYHLSKTAPFEVGEDERSRRFDAGEFPTCEIHFAVNDVDLLYHVVPGAEWDTAMCRYPV